MVMGRGIVASATIEIDTLVPLLLFGIASIFAHHTTHAGIQQGTSKIGELINIVTTG